MGAATGTGLYVIAVLGTALIIVILALLDRVESFARRRYNLGPPGYNVDRGDEPEGETKDMSP